MVNAMIEKTAELIDVPGGLIFKIEILIKQRFINMTKQLKNGFVCECGKRI